MKSLKNYISEAFKINKNTKLQKYNYFPETGEELKAIIKQRIKSEGNECDLNDIDTSKITDMSNLFFYSDFNGDISNWNVSNVKYMRRLFASSKFNQDISKWNVSNVISYVEIFDNCPIEEKYKPKFK